MLTRPREKIPNHNTFIWVGDFSEQIGKEEHLNNVAGKEVIHNHTNDNGMTCITPGIVTGNQIDHVQRMLKDVRAYSGENANSDHHLISAKIRNEFCSHKTGKQQKGKRWALHLLKKMRKYMKKCIANSLTAIAFLFLTAKH